MFFAVLGFALWAHLYKSKYEKSRPLPKTGSPDPPLEFDTVIPAKLKRRYYCHGKLKRSEIDYDPRKKEIYSPKGRAYLSAHALELRDHYGYKIVTNSQKS